MFVRAVKKNNNHLSIRIVKNIRHGKKVKQKTICCIGHTHKNNIEKIQLFTKIGKELIAKWAKDIQMVFPDIKQQLSSSCVSVQEKKKKPALPDDLVYAKSLKEEARISKGIEDIFGKVYEDLPIEECFPSGYKRKEVSCLLKEMVLSRLQNPVSKRKSVAEIKNKKHKALDLDRVYRMMDKLYEHREKVKKCVCDQTLSFLKKKVDVLLFDVTTLYFESFQADSLRQSGYSKDNKVKETQVVLSLMTTEEGLPVGYELFPGRTYEGHTLINTVDHISKSYEVRDVFLVADKGMFTRENLLKLEERGMKFIVGARLRAMKEEVKKEILQDLLKGKKNKFLKQKEDFTWSREYKGEENRRLIVHYSQKKASKDKREREKILEKIRKKKKNGVINITDLVSNQGIKKYLKITKKGSKQAILDKEKIQKESQWDGVSAIISNKKEVSTRELYTRYRSLWQIESAFRLNKHDLRMRPIYHWTPKRIKAHILICFIAYSLACFVRYYLKQQGMNISFERIKEELVSVQQSLITDTQSGKRFLLPSQMNRTQKTIYKCFHKNYCQTVQFLSPIN